MIVKTYCLLLKWTAYVFFIIIGGDLMAQDKNYESEYKSGYRGGFLNGIHVSDSALNFIAVGDWGRCGEYFQKEVAEQMAKASVSADISFILSTGDNFYPSGVASIDDPLWNRSFENIYSAYSLQKDWYVVLGNHDYKINPQAEIDYTKKSGRWHMPASYYSKTFFIDGDSTKQLLLVCMDSNPFIDKYYNDKEHGKQMKMQDSSAQRKWLVKTLSDKNPNIRWRVVAGHHPMYSSGKRINSAETLQFRKSLEGIFEQCKVDAYICGHEHQLEYIKPAGKTHHFISGAGSEIRPVKGDLKDSKFKASDHGFMIFSITSGYLKLYAINWEGKVLYEQTIPHN